MKISYVSPSDQSLASFRYRILIPASQIKEEIYVDAEPEEGADITVFSKHWKTNLFFAQKVRNAGSKIVYDICDDHFQDAHRLDYKAMCKRADVITCNSEAMRAKINEITGLDSVVIPDPYEMPLKEPSFFPESIPNLLWFGHGSGLYILEYTPIVGNLEIVTNCKESKQSGPVTWTQYTGKDLLAAMDRADLVILPQDKPCKSANRLIESLRQGKFCIASSIPAYEEFQDYAYICDSLDEFKDGILWALEHPQEVREKIKAGQAYIEKFSPQAIAARWETLFDSISGPGVTPSKDG